MADPQASRLTGGASALIPRRDAARWVAVALAGLQTGELFAQSTAPSDRRRQAEPVRFLDAATLRRTIRSAPEENPGQPGL